MTNQIFECPMCGGDGRLFVGFAPHPERCEVCEGAGTAPDEASWIELRVKHAEQEIARIKTAVHHAELKTERLRAKIMRAVGDLGDLKFRQGQIAVS